ncbi:MAG TPA: STAS domain-containing protein [Acidimicrobiales bacterium]
MSAPDSPHVRVLELGPMTIVGIEGDLELDSARLIDAEITQALERDSTIIVLDCSLLRSLGRSEVAVLARASDRVHQRHGRFVVREPNESTLALLTSDPAFVDLEVEA